MKLPFLAGVKIGDRIYYSAAQTNGLFYYDITQEKNHFISIFDREEVSDFLFRKAFLYKNKMWLVPFNGEHIVCVDLNTFEIMYYDIPNRGAGEKAFYDGIRKDNLLVLIPYHLDTIMVIDMDKGECSVLYQADYLKHFWARGGYINKDVVYITKSDGRVGLAINYLNGHLDYENEQIEGSTISTYALMLGNEYWLTNCESFIATRCNINADGVLEQIDIIHTNGVFANRGVKNGDKVILYPSRQTRGYIIYDSLSGEYETINNISSDEDCPMWFEVDTIDSDTGVWAADMNGTIIDFTNMNTIRCYQSTCTKDFVYDLYEAFKEKTINKKIDTSKIRYEGFAMMSLESFIDLIICEE